MIGQGPGGSGEFPMGFGSIKLELVVVVWCFCTYIVCSGASTQMQTGQCIIGFGTRAKESTDAKVCVHLQDHRSGLLVAEVKPCLGMEIHRSKHLSTEALVQVRREFRKSGGLSVEVEWRNISGFLHRKVFFPDSVSQKRHLDYRCYSRMQKTFKQGFDLFYNILRFRAQIGAIFTA